MDGPEQLAEQDRGGGPHAVANDAPRDPSPNGTPSLGLDRLARLMGAVAGLGADLDLPAVLRRIIEAATELVDASYGALGVLDESGTYLDQFLTVGIDPAGRAAIGELPKGHGILGLLIVEPVPIRLPDLAAHPDSFGFPPAHPPMTSFLGVPIFVRGEVYGNLYLTEKRDGRPFTAADEELAVGLAAAAAVAIENARLHIRVREVDLMLERERIARDLHDTVIQRLFATGLTLQGASRLIERPEPRERVEAAIDELDLTVREIRSAIFELQPVGVGATEGLRRRLLAVGRDVAGAMGAEPSFTFEGPVDAEVGPDLGVQVMAVVREGLVNVARHAPGSSASVTVRIVDGHVEVVVDDGGPGPGPPRPGGRGLANLVARAAELGGESALEARAEGGSRLRWAVPVG